MMRRTWIKLFVDQTLRGTCFAELEPDERFVWFGFLLLAGDSPIDGKICIQENMGFTDQQVAAMLKINIGLLERAKAKCVQFDKIRVLENNVLEIVNWPKYQSEYQRQKPYRHRAKNVPPGPPSSDSDTDGEGEGEGEEKVTPRYKRKLQAQVTDKEGEDGLLSIPNNLPFDVRDELVKRRADIRERRRILKEDQKTASCRRISESSIEKSVKEFNKRVRDYV